MDFVIQKSVELGVNEITPVFTERCNVKFDEKREKKKLCHWHKTIISACEQSGRAYLPKLNKPLMLSQLRPSNALSIYLEPTAEHSVANLNITRDLNLIIGPEGGFSVKDSNHLRHVGFTGIKLGPRILRTETAGLSIISILQNHAGDLN